MAKVGKTSNGLDAVVPAAQRKELISSSRNQATVHRTVAFDCSSPYRGSQIKNAIRMDGVFYLATSNGLEPSTSSVTGWRANRLHHEAMWCEQCGSNKRNYSR